MSLAFLLCFAVIPAAVLTDNDCSGRDDGKYDFSCRTYLLCTNGVGTQVECPVDKNGTQLVINMDTEMCDDPQNVPSPCGHKRDCSSLPDGRYTDLIYSKDCTAYYTCQNGYFYGHNICSAGLIFHEAKQYCDWPYNVPPPCGTAAAFGR